MALTSWGRRVTQWHQSLHALKALHKPLLSEQRDKIRPTSKQYTKTAVPTLVDYFDPTLSAPITDRAAHLANLANFVANQAAAVTPITADDTPIVLDSGCSIAISNDPLDFPEGYTPAPPNAGIRGVGSTLAMHGHGLIHWRLLDVLG